MDITMFVTTDQINAYLAENGLTTTEDKAPEIAIRFSQATSSQAKMAAFLINVTKGDITTDQLGDALRLAFPNAKVGDRHGPHYASLSRTGKLKGCNHSVAKAGRTSSNAKTEIATLRAAIENIKDAKNIKEVAKIIADLG